MLKFIVICLIPMLLLISCGPEEFNSEKRNDVPEIGEALKYLTSVVKELPGKNCLAGGSKIDQGFDTNKNGILDAEEVNKTEYVCNGKDGAAANDGKSCSIKISDGVKKVECEDGTSVILSDGENGSSCTISTNSAGEKIINCNDGTSETVSDGLSTLIKLIPEPESSNCQYGGKLLISAVDYNRNSEIDEDEILKKEYICNGSNGLNSLVKVITISPGDLCKDGGRRILIGKDNNSDGVLNYDSTAPFPNGEISFSEYLCGEFGEDGQKGSKGDVGPKGDKGDQGDKGIQGV